ncbi:eukaryotic translation initiation factor 3 subunit G-like [Montipora capricornis]|uniref:eukaryotic translation initiation factor 3 subunit G-like n=1 Tax=Montipora capricornis TaxID=246305 RepID=UPI0035F1671E
MPRSQRDESATIRVTNLSEDTRESDIMELFRPFGPISRIFLAKGKQTNQSKLWKLKFGDAKNDGPGPNPSSTTTTVTDDVFLILTTNKEVEVIQSQVTESKLATGAGAPAVSTGEQPAAVKIGKYIAPGLREGAANRRGETMPRSQRDESANIRVTNLSEDTRESDLMELFRPFGPISRIFLAKGKQTKGTCNFFYRGRPHVGILNLQLQIIIRDMYM